MVRTVLCSYQLLQQPTILKLQFLYFIGMETIQHSEHQISDFLDTGSAPALSQLLMLAQLTPLHRGSYKGFMGSSQDRQDHSWCAPNRSRTAVRTVRCLQRASMSLMGMHIGCGHTPVKAPHPVRFGKLSTGRPS